MPPYEDKHIANLGDPSYKTGGTGAHIQDRQILLSIKQNKKYLVVHFSLYIMKPSLNHIYRWKPYVDLFVATQLDYEYTQENDGVRLDVQHLTLFVSCINVKIKLGCIRMRHKYPQ